MKTIEIFEAGDVVELKSGGPNMTVEGINELTGDVVCCWFGESDLVSGDEFVPETLELVGDVE